MKENIQNSLNKKLLLCIMALILLLLFLLIKQMYFSGENRNKTISLAIDSTGNEAKIAIVLGAVGSLKFDNLIDLQKDITIGIPSYMKIEDDRKFIGYNVALNIDEESLDQNKNMLEYIDNMLRSNVPYQAVYFSDNKLWNNSSFIIENFLKSLKEKDIIFLNSTKTNSKFNNVVSDLEYPILKNNIFLDEKLSPEYIMQNLIDLEKIAQEKGFAIAIGYAYPLTIKTIKEWVSTLSNKGIKLVSIKDLYKDFGNN